MKLFAVALLARKTESVFERLEMIPVLVAAHSEREAGKEAKREVRKGHPKTEDWQITGGVVEIDQIELFEILFGNDSQYQRAHVIPTMD